MRLLLPEQRDSIEAILRDAQELSAARAFLRDLPDGQDAPDELLREIKRARLRIRANCFGGLA